MALQILLKLIKYILSFPALTEEYVLNGDASSPFSYDIVSHEHGRHRRDAVDNVTNAPATTPTVPSASIAPNASPTTTKIPVPNTESKYTNSLNLF